MAEMPPFRSGCQGTTNLAKVSGAGLWHYFVHRYRSARWSPEVKRKDKASVWAWEVTAAPQGSEHLGHHITGLWQHNRQRTQWWPGDVSGQARSWICCLSTARKLEQPCGTVPRHRAVTLRSGTLSAVCYLNGQPFRNTECWNAPQAKKMAEKICLDFSDLSLHTTMFVDQPCLWQKYWLYAEVPAPTAHLCCTICPHGAGHIPSTCQSSRESSSQPPLRMKWLNSSNLSWTLLSNYFHQTILLAQHKPSTAQKQEGNASPHLSPMSACSIKHTEHKGCVREFSRLLWLQKDFILDISSIKDPAGFKGKMVG